MNYDELEAGPEMDKLVAEVMGWKYSGFCRRGPVYIDDDGMEHDCGSGWNPSESCESAIQFAEAFTESFTLFSPTKTSPYWLCSSIAKGVKATSLGKAATPSLAICRSVLKMLAKDKS